MMQLLEVLGMNEALVLNSLALHFKLGVRLISFFLFKVSKYPFCEIGKYRGHPNL